MISPWSTNPEVVKYSEMARNPISMMIMNQHENLSTHVNRNITMPSFHRGWVPDTDVVPSSENRNTFVSFVSSK
jgi:hypothetical protein